MSLFKLSVLVQAIDQLSRPVRQMSSAVQGLDRVANAAKGLAKWGQGVAAAGAILGATAAGVTGALAAPVNASAKFNEAMSATQAVMRLTSDEMTSLISKSRELGATTQFGATDAALAMQQFGIAGFDTTQTLQAIGPALDLAKASSLDLGDSVEVTGAIMKSFHLDASRFGNIGDLLTGGFTSSATTLRDLGETISQVGNTAFERNVSLAETVALAGKLGDVGIRGSRGGTALNAILSRLAAPTGEAAIALRQLADVYELDEFGVRRFRPIIDILADMHSGLELVNDDALRAAKLQEIFGLEAAGAASALINLAGAGELQNYLKQLEDSNGLAKQTAQVMGDNLAGSFKNLASATESLFITLGDIMAPALMQVTQLATDLIRAFDAWALAHPVLSEAVLVTAGALAGLLAVVAPALLTIGLLSTTFGYVGIGAAAAGRALTFIGGQMTLIRGGLGLFGQALINGPVLAFSALRGAILSAFQAIAFRGGLGSFLQFQLLRANLSLQAAVAGIRAWAVAMARASFGAITALPARITALAVALRTSTFAFLANTRAAFTSLTAFQAMAGGLLTRLAAGLRLVGVGIRAMGLALAANPIGLAIAVIAGAALLIFKFWGPIKSFFKGVFSGIKEGLAPLAPAFASLGQVFNLVMIPIRAIGRFIGSLLTPINGASAGANSLGQHFGRVFAFILNWTVLLPIRLAGMVAKMIGSLFEGVSAIWSGITGFFGNMIDGVRNLFADGFPTGIGRILLNFNPLALLARSFNALFEFVFGVNLFDAGTKIITTLWDGMKAVASKPVEAIADIVKQVRDYLPFSPAKTGPLSDLNRIKLIETVADTVTGEPLVRAVRGAVVATNLTLAAGGAALALPIGAQAQVLQAPQVAPLPADGAQNATSGRTAPVTVHLEYNPQITFEGGLAAGSSGQEALKDQILQALREHDQELLTLIRSALDTDARSDFS